MRAEMKISARYKKSGVKIKSEKLYENSRSIQTDTAGPR